MALSVDTILQTPVGPRKITDVKVGDEVFDVNGNPIKILSIKDKGLLPARKLLFKNKTFLECDDTQLVKVYTTWDRTKPVKVHRSKICDIAEILDRGVTFNNGSNKFFFPVNRPLQYSKKSLPLDPYFLGLLLGDGHLSRDEIKLTVGNEELEILDLIADKIPSELKIKITQKAGCVCISFPRKIYNSRKKNPLRKIIEDLDLNVKGDTKFIPDIYKYSSVQDRIELLKGLMDSDGACSKGYASFSNTSERLIDDIIELLNSLGSLNSKLVSIRERENRSSVEFEVTVNSDFNPFKIQRKFGKWKSRDERWGFKKALNSIVDIEEKEMFAISVDAVDNLFLANHFVVTCGDSNGNFID